MGHYNNPESFPPAKRMEFFKWYNEQLEKKVVFDFRKEMQAYCHSDVHLLRLGMQKFRTIFRELKKTVHQWVWTLLIMSLLLEWHSTVFIVHIFFHLRQSLLCLAPPKPIIPSNRLYGWNTKHPSRMTLHSACM